MADLKNLDVSKAADKAATMHLVDPVEGGFLYADDDTQKKPMTIDLLGSDSKKFRAAVSKQQRKAARRGRGSPDLAQQERNAAELFAAVTTGWKNMLLGGQELEFSQENAMKLYVDYPWIRAQIDEFIADRGNYFKSE